MGIFQAFKYTGEDKQCRIPSLPLLFNRFANPYGDRFTMLPPGRVPFSKKASIFSIDSIAKQTSAVVGANRHKSQFEIISGEYIKWFGLQPMSN
jgi:hypothetical protein